MTDFVIYIAVDNPQKVYYGSTVAAPVFSSIASFALRKAGAEPILISENNLVEKRSELGQKVKSASTNLTAHATEFDTVPRLRGMTMREVNRLMRSSNVELEIVGRGEVAKTIPAEGKKLTLDKRLKVIFSSEY